ncbi:hypothetical protein ILUMI_02014 [Ignelater luminosus]|uniref:PiggyBac transposable element-derived protein domain-containing protein n=1 Tax=Ignelater luminosus TaxID=2038154 RepID=A0A8K0DIY9_IGNLU|nr:hypothetical protein ILUMI_02014 [Ignelater luminosus]
MRKPEATSCARAMSCRISSGHSKQLILTQEEGQVGVLPSAERRQIVKIAVFSCLPPMLIFPQKRMQQKFQLGLPSGKKSLLMNDESKDPAENEDLGEESDMDEMDKVEERDIGHTDVIELKTFIGLLYLAGVYKSNRPCLDELWGQDGDGIKKFGLVMSIKRFKILIRCLRFDDRNTRSERKALDRLASIREIFEKIVKNRQSSYSPSENFTIDEMLPGFKDKFCYLTDDARPNIRSDMIDHRGPMIQPGDFMEGLVNPEISTDRLVMTLQKKPVLLGKMLGCWSVKLKGADYQKLGLAYDQTTKTLLPHKYRWTRLGLEYDEEFGSTNDQRGTKEETPALYK